MNWKGIYATLAQTNDKYAFYDGTYSYADFEQSKIAKKIPRSRVGWGRRAVEMRANKTHFDTFENDTIGLNEVWEKYHGNKALDKIKGDILVGGVGFLALTGDHVMPFTAREATGTFDWRTQNIKDGVAVFRKKQERRAFLTEIMPDSYMRFFPDRMEVYDNDTLTITDNPTGRMLMTMLTYQSTTTQPFGRSVISRVARDAMIDASRTRRQASIAAYHYNVKVDVILGADVETTVDMIEAQTGDIVKIGTNENGQIPQIGQFAQHAMTPFSDSMMLAIRDFCTETKLTPANLGIASGAPDSPEALEIVGDDLRDDIQEWQREMGEQIKQFAVSVWMYDKNVRELDENLRRKIALITPTWLPIFKADISKFGDGLNKLAQIAPAVAKQRSVWRGLGLTSAEIDDVVKAANEGAFGGNILNNTIAKV